MHPVFGVHPVSTQNKTLMGGDPKIDTALVGLRDVLQGKVKI